MIHMTMTQQDSASGMFHVFCRCGWAETAATQGDARDAGDAHLDATNRAGDTK